MQRGVPAVASLSHATVRQLVRRGARHAARKTGLSLGNVEALVLRLLTCGNKSKPRGWARAKNGIPSVHPLTGTELRALLRLQREQEPGRYVFLSERGVPVSAAGFRRMITRLGKAAKMPFSVHPHMLRHACGFKLANDGQDTRALQHWRALHITRHGGRSYVSRTQLHVTQVLAVASVSWPD